MKRVRKLVLVEWMDSHAGRGWQAVEQFDKAAEPLYCRSVGWLISESKDCKVIVPHIAGERNGDLALEGRGDLSIPKRAILRTTILKEP